VAARVGARVEAEQFQGAPADAAGAVDVADVGLHRLLRRLEQALHGAADVGGVGNLDFVGGDAGVGRAAGALALGGRGVAAGVGAPAGRRVRAGSAARAGARSGAAGRALTAAVAPVAGQDLVALLWGQGGAAAGERNGKRKNDNDA